MNVCYITGLLLVTYTTIIYGYITVLSNKKCKKVRFFSFFGLTNRKTMIQYAVYSKLLLCSLPVYTPYTVYSIYIYSIYLSFIYKGVCEKNQTFFILPLDKCKICAIICSIQVELYGILFQQCSCRKNKKNLHFSYKQHLTDENSMLYYR